MFFTTGTTGSAFGSNASTVSGLFGQQPATANAFGSTTTSAFGQPAQQTTGFGGGGFGQTAGGANQGTSVADFAPTQDRDITTGVNNFFQTITAMPQYKNYSLEELRLQDYQQGRKTAGTAGAFGATASTPAFGAANTNSAFGQTSTSNAFGSTNTTTPAFGGGFGTNNTTTGGAFGQAPTATSSAFGQPAATGNAFGSSAFGQNNNQATGTFGSGTGAFGAAASKPFSFGVF